ncbi:MAG: replication-relaxation family protein [Anaerolineae bacterium]|nr:replication-relaxation family protein [Anaerolineae bacterium]
MSSQRLPRSRRVAPDARPPMHLTARDVAIIQVVNDYRALLGNQIEALFFGSRSTAQYRLSRLFQHEFLERHFLTVVSGGPGSSPTVYTLGKRGAQVLIDTLGYEQNALRLPKKAGFAWGFLEHLLKINDVRVAVTLACRAQSWALETWWDEPIFRANPDHITLTDKRGTSHKKPVLPDGYFCLRVPQGMARFFLEVDRGSEPHSVFRPQVQVYEAYIRSGQYQARFAAKSLRVLIVTTTARRLANLKAVTKQAGGDRKYWFSTFAELTPETVLTAPIWQTMESSARQPLIALTSAT